MQKLEEIIGYQFKNPRLLQQALTHSSCNIAIGENYERLEFLGDRVLGVAIAHLLYTIFPHDPEGNLSPRYVRLVRKETVAAVALNLHIDNYIQAEHKQLCRNVNILCDVTEAIIGAVYLDSDIDTAIALVERHWQQLINTADQPPKDNKTCLQELAHKLNLGTPVYTLIQKEGSEHQPRFCMKVALKENLQAIGSGTSKKQAEQEAAAKLLAELEKSHD